MVVEVDIRIVEGDCRFAHFRHYAVFVCDSDFALDSRVLLPKVGELFVVLGLRLDVAERQLFVVGLHFLQLFQRLLGDFERQALSKDVDCEKRRVRHPPKLWLQLQLLYQFIIEMTQDSLAPLFTLSLCQLKLR